MVSAAPLLELQNISYGYSEERLALRQVSVAIGQGERIAVLGNNGAGKSTLFLCCNGIIHPQEGTVLLRGEPITYQKRQLMALRKAVGLVFQDPDDQILASTVEAEISFGPMNLGLELPEVSRRVNAALTAMDLEDYRTRPPHYLSGGEKKRVTIGDILAMEPQLILFDEPTASLDPKNTVRLREILTGLGDQGMALMVATHDIEFAYAWAERILVFHQGALLADRPADQVFCDEALLAKAGLKQPLLYAAALAVCRDKQVPAPLVLPKTVEEFPAFLQAVGSR